MPVAGFGLGFPRDIKPPSLIIIGHVVNQFEEQNLNNNGYFQAIESEDAVLSDFRRYTAA